MNTSIKGKESEEERDPPGGGKILEREKKEGYNAPRTLPEDLDPATHTKGRLS